MWTNNPTSVLLPQAALDRIARLAEQMARQPHPSGRITKSSVMRFALLRGLELLEQEQGVRR